MGFFHVPPPPPVVAAAATQPYAPGKIAAVTVVPAVVNPPPFSHPARVSTNIAVSAQLAQPPDWPVVYVAERSGQPYAGPLLPDASVKPPDPPFSHPERQTAYIALYAQSAQPSDWPFVYPGERGRQPYAGPLLPDASVKPPDPPFSHPERGTAQIALDAQLKQPDPWQYVYPLRLSFQPYGGGLLSPGIPGQSVDNPVPNARGVAGVYGIDRAWWEPPDPQPQQIGKLSPGIPGQSVDNPPILLRQQSFYPADQVIPQSVRYLPQGAAAVVTTQSPYSNAWIATVVQAWQPGDYLPLLQRYLVQPFVPSNPPFGFRSPIFRADDLPYPQQPQRHVVQGAAPAVAQSPYSDAWLVTVLQAWQSGDYLPTLPRRYVVQPGTVSADNPPFGLLETIYEPWLGDPPLPTLPRRVVPFTAPSVDNPPFGLLYTIVDPWLGDPPLPTLPRRIVQPAPVVNNPPFTNFSRGAYQVVYFSWLPPDPLPTLSNKITPPSVDLPPPFYPLAITWGPDDPLPTLPPKFTPPYRPDNPSFTNFGRGPYQIVGFSWLPPDPLPTLRVKQTPPSVVPAADNPPFGLLETIYEPWLEPWSVFPPYNYRVLVVQPGTATPPLSNPREFTVSGQTVQDLFRPVGSISWNWGGKVSKRTT